MSSSDSAVLATVNVAVPPRLNREARRQQTVPALRAEAPRQFALLGVGGLSTERMVEHADVTRGVFCVNVSNQQRLLPPRLLITLLRGVTRIAQPTKASEQ